MLLVNLYTSPLRSIRSVASMSPLGLMYIVLSAFTIEISGRDTRTKEKTSNRMIVVLVFVLEGITFSFIVGKT